MARKSKKLPESHGDMHPPALKSWVQDVAALIAKASSGFRRDTFCFTVIGALALISSAFGQGGTFALAFASFFMLLVPILRHFRLIDT